VDPLAGLRAIAEAVQDGIVDDPSTLQRYAGEIGRTVGSLSVLVDDRMELSQLDGESVRAETGGISVESAPDRGSRFAILIPEK
jgi:signal transduction histidine kinase